MKLSIPENQLGRDKAEKYVIGLCKKIGIKIETKAHLREQIQLALSQKIIAIDLPHEVTYAMRNGRADRLQIIRDSKDIFLNTPVSLGIANVPPGLKIDLNSSYGQHSSNLIGPGLIEPPETSFANEITYYRREAVVAFNAEDLGSFARCYRSYLQSCISLVECFIHRYTFHIRGMIPSMAEYENTETLDSRQSIEKRIEAWISTFATHKSAEILNSRHRSKFLELKTQRNSIVHPSEPTVTYQVNTVVKYLNYASEGVGGFLAELRRHADTADNIGFINQVRTQPNIIISKG